MYTRYDKTLELDTPLDIGSKLLLLSPNPEVNPLYLTFPALTFVSGIMLYFDDLPSNNSWNGAIAFDLVGSAGIIALYFYL